MAGSLRDKLNPIYQRLFTSRAFDQPAVEEPRATCESCAMCDKGEAAPVTMGYFEPSVKCCTWQPTIFNFLIGAILADEGPALEEGRRRIRERVASRQGILPLAVMAPGRYRVLYTAAKGSSFGQAKELLCPFYASASGGCTVWQYREAVCSTWFCKNQDGKAGNEFWGAMKAYLAHAESILAFSALNAVDASLQTPNIDPPRITLEELESRPPTEARYAALWGSWVGREEELYRKCHAYVQEISPARFTSLVDATPVGQQRLAELADKRAQIERRKVLPLRLQRASDISIRDRGEESLLLAPHNPYDTFAVDRELFDVLAKLDGTQTLTQNLERLDEEEGVELAPDLLQYLFTHGVLEEPAPAAPATPQAALAKKKDKRASRR